MRLQEVLNQVDGLEKRFVYYLESQGYIHPQKVQKARIARRDYSVADLERIRGIWHYYQRGISVQRAYELVTRAAADGAYVFFPVPPRRWCDALDLLRESDHVVEAAALYGETADFVARLLSDVVAPGGRLLVGVYNEEKDRDTVAAQLRSWGYDVSGATSRAHRDPRLRYKAVWVDA